MISKSHGRSPREEFFSCLGAGDIWEIFPEDLDHKVAEYVRSDSYYKALDFAKSSERQSRAMAEALGFKLVLHEAHKEDMADWIAIFGDSLRHLDSSNMRETKLPRSFRALSGLKTAEILGTKSHYNTVKFAPRLKSLKVVLKSEANWTSLVKVCATLRLEELSLDCELNDYCCRRDLSIDELFSLADACPKVTKLDMKCTCMVTVSYWPLVTRFRSLTHLNLYQKVDSGTIPFLQSLKEVEFCDMNIPIRHILPIHSNVTAVSQLRRASAKTVELLAHFPQVKTLNLAMADGAEKILPRVVEKVEVLRLSWGYDDFYDEDDDPEYGDGPMDFDSEVTQLYQPDPCVMKEIVHSAQHLRELHLTRAVVHVDLLQKVIKLMGLRLEKLSIHMDRQGERQAVRLSRILLSVATYSPNIKKITLLGPLEYKEATSQEKKECYEALQLLKKRAPLSATTKIRHFIDGIEEIN